MVAGGLRREGLSLERDREEDGAWVDDRVTERRDAHARERGGRESNGMKISMMDMLNGYVK